MMRQWRFVTGSVGSSDRVEGLRRRGRREDGLISHTPALFMIDPEGREAKLYMTPQSYSAVGQLGQILAQEASALLPSPPRVRSDLSYAQVSGITPAMRTSVPRAGGGMLARARRLAPPVCVLRYLGPGGNESCRTPGCVWTRINRRPPARRCRSWHRGGRGQCGTVPLRSFELPRCAPASSLLSSWDRSERSDRGWL